MKDRGLDRDDGPEEALTPELEERLRRLVPHLLRLGMGCVHSAECEGDGKEDSPVDCSGLVPVGRAVCCSYRFALTAEEVERDIIAWDRREPHFIARGDSGYCTHLDPDTLRCRNWEDRPLRCRRYDCRRENTPWEDPEGLVLKKGAFDHLPGSGE